MRFHGREMRRKKRGQNHENPLDEYEGRGIRATISRLPKMPVTGRGKRATYC